MIDDWLMVAALCLSHKHTKMMMMMMMVIMMMIIIMIMMRWWLSWWSWSFWIRKLTKRRLNSGIADMPQRQSILAPLAEGQLGISSTIKRQQGNYPEWSGRFTFAQSVIVNHRRRHSIIWEIGLKIVESANFTDINFSLNLNFWNFLPLRLLQVPRDSPWKMLCNLVFGTPMWLFNVWKHLDKYWDSCGNLSLKIWDE